MRIFISYRRSDDEFFAGRVRDRLVEHFGSDNVFLDVDSILPGFDFRTAIDSSIKQSDIVLVLIGAGWEIGRLQSERDFVRLELEAALAHGKVVIPILVENQAMPEPSEFPRSLREVSFINAHRIRKTRDFNHDVDLLVEIIEHRWTEILEARRREQEEREAERVAAAEAEEAARRAEKVRPEEAARRAEGIRREELARQRRQEQDAARAQRRRADASEEAARTPDETPDRSGRRTVRGVPVRRALIAALAITVVGIGAVVAVVVSRGRSSGTAPTTAVTASTEPSVTSAPTTAPTTVPATALAGIPCEGQHRSATVTVLGSFTDDVANALAAAVRPFTECTGAEVEYQNTGAAVFDVLQTRIQSGRVPDVAVLGQRSDLVALAGPGWLAALNEFASTIGRDFAEGWVAIGSVDGVLYGVPLAADLKSLVWYNASSFEAKGYEPPTNWPEMIELSDRIVREGGTPWCEGVESGEFTGWPASDWLESVMLRMYGTDVYDQWVAHQFPFNDPLVVTATGMVAELIRNGAFVRNGVQSIATTPFAEAGGGLIDGSCYMYRQASFMLPFLAEMLAPRDQPIEISAFPLPEIDPALPDAWLVTARLAVATADRPEVVNLMRYLASSRFADEWILRTPSTAAVLSPNREMTVSEIPNALHRLLETQLIAAPSVRLDGSDNMPADVAATFLRSITTWLGTGDTEAMLDEVEQAWLE